MSDWPSLWMPGALVTVFPWSTCSIGQFYPGSANPVSATWTTANRAYFIQFRLSRPLLVVKLMALSGATVGTNNSDVGIYDAGGTLIVSSGATLTANANAIQEFNITDTLLGTGLFYLAMSMNGSSYSIQNE